MSRIAGLSARILTKADLQDPMSGFFVMRRQAFDNVVRHLSKQGFENTSRYIRIGADGFAL